MDTVQVIVYSVISLFLVALALFILSGWGDGLIAGYNTASKEEQNQYNLKRLRAVVAVMILFGTVFIWCVAWLDDTVAVLLGALPVFVIVIFASIIIVNTWCKKK